LRMLIWPEASNAQNYMAAVSADGSTVCVLIRRLCECDGSGAMPIRLLLEHDHSFTLEEFSSLVCSISAAIPGAGAVRVSYCRGR
jgi:hypothetical protein